MRKFINYYYNVILPDKFIDKIVSAIFDMKIPRIFLPKMGNIGRNSNKDNTEKLIHTKFYHI